MAGDGLASPQVMTFQGATVRARLLEAAGTGEILSVIYWGGSQPGRQRDIAVRKVDGDYVEVLCLSAGEPRKMRIDRLEEGSKVVTRETMYRPAPRRRRKRKDDDGVVFGVVLAESLDLASERMIAGMSGAWVGAPAVPAWRDEASDRMIRGMGDAGRLRDRHG